MRDRTDRNYRAASSLLRCISRLDGARVIGAENIPPEGPLLIICNHTSLGDPPVISSFYPYRITYIAKEGFSRRPFTRWLFSALGAVFLNKDDGDMAAMRAALQELKRGRAVAIFPEGRRNFNQELGPFHEGAAFIAYRARVRVLPMAVVNAADFLHPFRRNIRLVVGEPFPVPEGRADREALARTTAAYRQRIEELFNLGVCQVRAAGRPMYHTDKVNK